LEVTATNTGHASVRAVLEITPPSGPLRRAEFKLPFKLDLAPRTGYDLTVNVDSPGDDSTVVVTTQITGADSQPPEVCTVVVNEGHEHAEVVILVSTE
jgi:hypothetical protein